jgi:acyl-CoA reductase-like NAD-dependent aldehyde dehydrogenase
LVAVSLKGYGRTYGQPGCRQVSFTGSTAVGKSAMHNAADTMQRVTLELGGKSAHIALDGANVEQAGVKEFAVVGLRG